MTTAESEAAPAVAAEPEPTKPAKKQPKSTIAKLIDLARWVAVIVVVGLAVRELIRNWDAFWATLSGIAWQSSALSLVVLVASIGVSTLAWQIMVDDLGKPIGYRRGAQICLVGALGKYVPGSVWQYLLQMELGKKVGLARARIFTAALIQFGVGIVAALVLSILAMPAVFSNSPRAAWLFVLLPIGLVVLHPRILTWGISLLLRLLRRPPLDHRLSYSTVGKVFGVSMTAWALQGIHLWLLANSVGAPGFGGLILCIGAMAISLTAGNFAFILPAGAGVREAVQIAVLMASGLTVVQAGAFSVASRVMFIVADLITAGGAAATARLSLKSTDNAGAVDADEKPGPDNAPEPDPDEPENSLTERNDAEEPATDTGGPRSPAESAGVVEPATDGTEPSAEWEHGSAEPAAGESKADKNAPGN